MSRHVIYTHFAVRGSGCLTLKLSATFQAAHRENRIVSTGPSTLGRLALFSSSFLPVRFYRCAPLDRQLRRLRSAPRANNRGRPFSFP